MSDFFRIIRGLEIDETVRIFKGTGAPGSTADTDSSQVGSIYLDHLNGDLYIKYLSGVGSTSWRLATSAGHIYQLFGENLVSPVPSLAQGDNSVVIGSGALTDVPAANSVAIGDQSFARLPGGVVQANGRFASSGDAQVGRYVLRGHTATNFETEIFIDGTGGSTRLALPDDSTWTFRVTITGHRTDVSDGHAGFTIDGVIYRVAGASTVALVGKPVKTVLAKSNRQWDVTASADVTNGSLKLTCTGQAGKIIRWVALVETVEVTN